MPKVFKWSEIFWKGQRLWLKNHGAEKRIQNFLSQKHFPTLKKMALSIYKKINSKTDYFWNWYYFGGEFFQAVIKSLLEDAHGPYQLFTCFKQHIEECEKELNKIEDGNEKEKYFQNIKRVFARFCPIFFNEIDSSPSKYDIWEHYFPKEWKISMANIKNKNSEIILKEFVEWSQERIFKKDNDAHFDKDLTEVINGVFPNVHPPLFRAFLMLFHSTDIKNALEKEPNFSISSIGLIESGSDDDLPEMMREEESSQKEETIQIILNYFYFWRTLKPYKEDLTEDEFEKWKNFTEDKRQSLIKRVRKEKLEKLRNEIESEEIKEICKDSEQKEFYREDFLELVGLLLLEIEK